MTATNRLMQTASTASTAFERHLARLIEENIETLREEIAAGQLETMERYKFTSGRIAGLRLAMDHFSEANRLVNQR